MPSLPGDLELRYVQTIDDAMDLKRWLSEDRGRSCIGVDTETSGLTWNRPGDRLRLVQIGDRRAGWSIPWDQWGGAFMEVLNSWDGQIALHNASYDLKFLTRYANWQVPWDRLHDTMIMARIMRPDKRAALKPLATELVDPRGAFLQKKLDEVMTKHKWTWDTVPLDLPEYHMYGALDPVETAYLYDIFRADLAFPEVYDLEMSTLRICYNMEVSGFRVDLEYAQNKMNELNDFADQSREWGKETLGISIGSPGQLVRFFEGLGAEITERTPSGGPSMNAEQLEIFTKHSNPKVRKVAELASDARKAEKLAKTYFKAIVEQSVDSRVHPSINTLGAKTGRMSVSNPNMQNLPSRAGAIVKNAYLPDENEVLLSSDLDQVEFRLVSCLANDAGLIDLFNTADAGGGDVFTQIGRELYRDPNMEKSDPRRATVKTYVYSRLYGASVQKQAASAGVSVEVMQEVADRFDESYPGVTLFQNGIINQIEREARQTGREGHITSPLTKRQVPVEKGAAYKGINYLVQGLAAEVMKRNLVKLDAAGFGSAMRMPVHDEIILSVPKEDEADAKHLVAECMTTIGDFDLPLTADCSDGLSRWGEKY